MARAEPSLPEPSRNLNQAEVPNQAIFVMDNVLALARRTNEAYPNVQAPPDLGIDVDGDVLGHQVLHPDLDENVPAAPLEHLPYLDLDNNAPGDNPVLQNLPLDCQPYQEPAEKHSIGPMNFRCTHYDALHYKGEYLVKSSIRNPKFGMCCLQGKIILPLLPELPNTL